MNLGFEIRGVQIAAKRLIEIAAQNNQSSMVDCSDLADQTKVEQYLMSFAENEFSEQKNIEEGKIYGCAYKGIFVVFESMEHVVNISPMPFTRNGLPSTHLAYFWECLC